ncbi:MAG TPA: L-seryl-tRNA(Sec) selenium transferase [Longimicrobiales bacterium]|nr:L-seryl-tRNA(Sec) selenium transferase [Longimicrobiales bacterium]
MSDARRALPSVDRLLSSAEFGTLLTDQPRELVAIMLKDELAQVRAGLSAAAPLPPELREAAFYAARVRAAITRASTASLVPVLNATGVVLHTNLGRAPLAVAAVDAIQRIALGYSNLEYDMDSGSRGSRYSHCRDILVRLTGAEDALVVNNNAAALVLALNTLARGLDAIISRGELVEIGGAFRVPEIMARSGAVLHEVGATNRTHIDDYRGALSARTGVLLKVHPSNFTMAGYTADVGVADLAGVARGAGVPLVHDIGSGLLLPPAELGLPAHEPTPAASLAAGADIITLSGDKLLGGPQCGIVLGRAALIDRMRRNPLCRALRVDKLTLAALAATLRLYLDPARARREIPVLRMLTLVPEELNARAAALAARCADAGVPCRTFMASSAVGGGATPAAVLPTVLVQITIAQPRASELEQRLRSGEPHVIARIVDDCVALDLRTVPPDADDALGAAVLRACTS